MAFKGEKIFLSHVSRETSLLSLALKVVKYKQDLRNRKGKERENDG